MEDEQVTRARRALLFGALPGVLGALLVGGGLPFGIPPVFAFAVGMMGAPAAGFLIGDDTADKVFSTIAALIGGAGFILATVGYVESRKHMLSAELLIPIVLGGLPGLATFYVLRALAPRPLARIVVALLASVVTFTLVAVS